MRKLDFFYMQHIKVFDVSRHEVMASVGKRIEIKMIEATHLSLFWAKFKCHYMHFCYVLLFHANLQEFLFDVYIEANGWLMAYVGHTIIVVSMIQSQQV